MERVLECLSCAKVFPLEVTEFTCTCGGLLELRQPLVEIKGQQADWREVFRRRRLSNKPQDVSGVWRFRELLFEPPEVITRCEGNTRLYAAPKLAAELDLSVYFKHEGENPTGSFKDRGMTTAISAGRMLGCTQFICASTGNTSASLASYTAGAGLKGSVLIPEGKIAFGKLSQTLAYGARVLQIEGNFDLAMEIVRDLGRNFAENKIYLLNSLNPFRIEGQKTIFFELLEQLDYVPPDFIFVPAGNLGNTSALGKAILEAAELGLLTKKPRLVAVQAAGANPFYQYFQKGWRNFQPVKEPETVATAVRIGNPISYLRAQKVLLALDGLVLQATEEEILEAKAELDAAGIGCEPASACTLVGIKQLKEQGVLQAGQTVVGILTGNLLKDPETTLNYHLQRLAGIEAKFANQPHKIKASLSSVLQNLR